MEDLKEEGEIAMTVKQYDIESLLSMRTFTYTYEVDGETSYR